MHQRSCFMYTSGTPPGGWSNTFLFFLLTKDQRIKISRAIRSYLQLSEAIWSYLKLSGAICSYPELSVAIRSYPELSVAIWSYQELSVFDFFWIIDYCQNIRKIKCWFFKESHNKKQWLFNVQYFKK